MHFCHPLLRLPIFGLALLLALPCPSLLAKEARESRAAHTEREKGTVALNLGRYEEAVEHLTQAYTLTQDPLLLFSLGQAFRLSGKPEKALASYSAFLRAAGPNPKYRFQLERATAELETITAFLLNRPSDHTDREKQPDDLIAAERSKAEKDAKPRMETPQPVETAKVEENLEPPPALVVVPTPALLPSSPPPPPPPALVLTPQPAAPISPAAVAPQNHIYNRWWFWTSVAGAVAVGSATAWWLTRPDTQLPPSTYGTVRVLP